FASMIVSRPDSGARLLRRMRGLAVAAGLYVAGLACLVVAPLLMIEMVAPPRAAIDIRFPEQRGGNYQPAGSVRQGVRNGSEHAARSAADRRAPARRRDQPVSIPVTPPESEATSAPFPDGDGQGDGPPEGVPGGPGKNPNGPVGECPGCEGAGPGGEKGVDP